MGYFTGKISAEFTPPQTWELDKPLSFVVTELTGDEIKHLKNIGVDITPNGKITCKIGMKTDLASVPRIVWNLVAPWDIARAAVIHDYLYAKLRNYYEEAIRKPETPKNKSVWRKTRKISDKILLLGMKAAEPAVPAWKKYGAYESVRIFGGWPASKKK